MLPSERWPTRELNHGGAKHAKADALTIRATHAVTRRGMKVMTITQRDLIQTSFGLRHSVITPVGAASTDRTWDAQTIRMVMSGDLAAFNPISPRLE